MPMLSRATGREAILEPLAKSDPANAEWQRDLASTLERAGIALAGEGDLSAALKQYQESLQIKARLAQSDPQNAKWQNDLAFTYAKMADALSKAARRPKQGKRSSPAVTSWSRSPRNIRTGKSGNKIFRGSMRSLPEGAVARALLRLRLVPVKPLQHR